MSSETLEYSYVGLNPIAHPKKQAHKLYDRTATLPFSPEYLANGIPQILPFTPLDSLKKWKPSTFQFVKAGHSHNRSLIASTKDEFGRPKPIQVIFGDEYGNWYSELNTKGNVFTIPEGRVTVTDLNPQGTIDTWGTYNKDLLDRALSASQVFRELGIDAEYILYAEQVDQFLHPTTLKTVAVDQIRTFAKTHLQIHDSEGVSTEAHEKFDNLDFITLLRGVKISQRLNDVREVMSGSEDDIRSFFNRLISLHNFDCERRGKKGTNVPGIHEKLEPYELERYISDILPKRLAHNIALMHNAGIIHRFLHLGNLTLLGEIVDLDSPVGKLIDPTDTNQRGIYGYAMDLWEFFSSNSVKDIMEPLKNGYPDPHVINKNVPQLIRSFAQSFIEEYMRTRKVKKDSIEELQLKLFHTATHMHDRNLQLLPFALPQAMSNILGKNARLFDPKFINQLLATFGHINIHSPASNPTLIDDNPVKLEEKVMRNLADALAQAMPDIAQEIRKKMKRERINLSEGMHILFIHYQALMYTYISQLEEHMKRRKSFKQLSEYEQQKTLRIARTCMIGRFGISGYSHFRTAIMPEMPVPEKVAQIRLLLIQPLL